MAVSKSPICSTHLRCALAISTLLIALVPVGRTVAEIPASSNATQPSVVRCACVLLKNDNVLFGTAQQLGEFVIVRTGPNDELRLPRSEVACWANSLPDLYRYRVDQRVNTDLGTILADVRWCLQHELPDQAAKDLAAAKALSPNHRQVQLLEGQLQRQRQRATDRSGYAPFGFVAPAGFVEDSNADDNDVGAANRVAPATLHAFASHVQPILINRCGRCHSQNSNLAWRLTVPATGTRPTAPITRENLAAAIRFVDPSDPQQSTLLLKATSPHGGDKAPLSARNAKAIDAFRRWLSMTTGSLQGSPLSTIEADKQRPTAKPESAIAPVSFEADVVTASKQPTTSANDSDQPKRLPTVANPFDPSLFNRRFHRQDK